MFSPLFWREIGLITALELTNWKSHSSSSFSFAKGTNILVGRMGSGKSSVLDALCFALYGTFPKMTRRDQSTDTIVNMASGEAYAEVKLEFEKGGKKYSVHRKIGKKVSEAELRCDGKLLQKGPKQVTDSITDALGVDYELFTRAIYSEQNRIDYLLSLTPKARKQEIDWLLGLGQFDDAREAATTAAGKLSELSALLHSEADATRISSAKQKIDETKGQISEKKTAHANLGKKSEELSSALSGKEKLLSASEKLRGEYQRDKTACDIQKGALQRLSRDTQGKQKPQKAELELLASARKHHEEQVQSAKQSAKKHQADLSSLKSEIAVLQSSKKLAESRAKAKAQLEEKIARLSAGKTLPQLEEEASALKKDIETLSDSQSMLHAECNELSEAIGKLGGKGGKCPVCDSDLTHERAHTLAGEKKSLIEHKKAEAEKAAKSLAEKKHALSTLEKSISELLLDTKEMARISKEGMDTTEIDAKLAALIERKARAEAEYEKSDSALSLLEKQVEQSRTSHEEAVRTQKLFEDLEATQEKLSSLETKLASLHFDEAKYEQERSETQSLRLEHAKITSEQKGAEQNLSLMENMLSLLEKELSELHKKERLAKKYADAAQGTAIFKNSLAYAQSELRRLLVEEINAALSEIWPSVYPYSDYGAIKLEADEKDYRLLMQKGEWREVDAVASGGERACLCLALRIAFATVLTPDIGWLILDEPTHNLDAEAVQLLSEAINDKIPSIVEQTFVITHEPSLGETGQGNVFRLERDKNKNENTRVLHA